MMVKTIRKKVELDEGNAQWFEETYPGGSYSWLFNLFLDKFRALHTDNTPAVVISQAAKEVQELIEEGGS